ncbi:hypothetical protein SADUNF_Sadunf01G0027700 [Salix dunnii]|uniref:Fucosyltransferase n=1 Tax=Salix dunnii TaxID=1413687 RepID=A0A835NA13_9ROSI|nr:hypothetical protein SADUNF_Sadunf01G0027700 [Salix dunnii]
MKTKDHFVSDVNFLTHLSVKFEKFKYLYKNLPLFPFSNCLQAGADPLLSKLRHPEIMEIFSGLHGEKLGPIISKKFKTFLVSCLVFLPTLLLVQEMIPAINLPAWIPPPGILVLSLCPEGKAPARSSRYTRTYPSPSRNQTSKAILSTSLYSGYYQKMHTMYRAKPTATGEAIGVYQPSHEEYQHVGDNMHNMKAWAEIYLSLCDALVTRSSSTFGHVAHGFAGLKPWILRKPGKVNPACLRAISMEPCCHYHPRLGCKTRNKVNVCCRFRAHQF